MAPTGYDNQFYGADNSNVYTGQVFTPAPLPMDPAAGGKSYGPARAARTLTMNLHCWKVGVPWESWEATWNYLLLISLIAELGINPQHIMQKVSENDTRCCWCMRYR